MAKKRRTQPGPKDRHKPRRLYALPEALAAKMDALARRHFTNPTQEVIRACREYAERLGVLPTPADDQRMN